MMSLTVLATVCALLFITHAGEYLVFGNIGAGFGFEEVETDCKGRPIERKKS